MERSEAFAKLAEVVSSVMGVDAGSISEATTFADLDADSLDQVQLMMGIEDAFGIEIADEALDKIDSVAAALDAIAAALA